MPVHVWERVIDQAPRIVRAFLRAMRSLFLASTFAAIFAAACGPRVPPEVIAQHRRVELEADRPAIVASSGQAPRWVRALERGDADTIVFVGQASASALDAAERAAGADLSDAVARFIAVSVASEMEATDTHESTNGKTVETTDVHAETRAHVEASIGRVAPDGSYWEKVSGRTGPATYRYFLRAAVKRSEVARARLTIACERAKKSGKKIIAVAHADSMLGDLETRIAADSKWFVIGADDLRAASPVTPSSLSADLVLEARAVLSGGNIALSFVLKNAGDGSVRASQQRSGTSSALFELEDDLWASLQAALRSF